MRVEIGWERGSKEAGGEATVRLFDEIDGERGCVLCRYEGGERVGEGE